MKIRKLIALALAVLTITMAFAPNALAVTYAPFLWSSWALQKTSSYDYRYTLAIQEFMNINENCTLTIDGIFGNDTDYAVRQFQTHNPNLTVDGKVGANTWSTMSLYLLHEDYYYGVYDIDPDYLHYMIDNTGLDTNNKYGDYYVFHTSLSYLSGCPHYRYTQANHWLVYTKLGAYNSNASWIWYYIYK